MKRLPSDYTAEFEFNLRAIYQKQPDEFKKRVDELDFATSFSIIFVSVQINMVKQHIFQQPRSPTKAFHIF